MREGRTLCQRATVEGRGIRSGVPVAVELLPAQHPHGIRLRVARSGSDLGAGVAALRPCARALEIGGGGARFLGVEHLLAACHGLGICCLTVVIPGGEAPGLDGSAGHWVDAMDRAGLAACGGKRRFLSGTPVALRGAGEASIRYRPADENLEIAYTVDFRAHGGQVEQIRLLLDERRFRTELAAARTFAVRGVDPDALAGVEAPELWTDTPPAERRFPDELVRHKVLDLLGDLALLGRPIAGRIDAHCAGHGLHQQLARVLAEDADG